MAKKSFKVPQFKIESVTTTEKSVTAMFRGARLIYDAISTVDESEYEGTVTYNFKAGLEIPEGKPLSDLIAQIKKTFGALKLKGWANSVALEHFSEKKFQKASQDGFRLLYPTSPAVEREDGGFEPKAKLFINPSPDVFYAGCYVDALVAFTANSRGSITIKDYLNGIKFVGDGEPISGAIDPFGGSQAKAVVKGARRAPKAEEKKGKAKKKK